MRNGVNPLRRRYAARPTARKADDGAGRRCWRKRTPLCNGADRENIPARKGADFRLVFRDEKSRRTCAGGKANERNLRIACASLDDKSPEGFNANTPAFEKRRLS